MKRTFAIFCTALVLNGAASPALLRAEAPFKQSKDGKIKGTLSDWGVVVIKSKNNTKIFHCWHDDCYYASGWVPLYILTQTSDSGDEYSTQGGQYSAQVVSYELKFDRVSGKSEISCKIADDPICKNSPSVQITIEPRGSPAIEVALAGASAPAPPAQASPTPAKPQGQTTQSSSKKPALGAHEGSAAEQQTRRRRRTRGTPGPAPSDESTAEGPTGTLTPPPDESAIQACVAAGVAKPQCEAIEELFRGDKAAQATLAFILRNGGDEANALRSQLNPPLKDKENLKRIATAAIAKQWEGLLRQAGPKFKVNSDEWLRTTPHPLAGWLTKYGIGQGDLTKFYCTLQASPSDFAMLRQSVQPAMPAAPPAAPGGPPVYNHVQAGVVQGAINSSGLPTVAQSGKIAATASSNEQSSAVMGAGFDGGAARNPFDLLVCAGGPGQGSGHPLSGLGAAAVPGPKPTLQGHPVEDEPKDSTRLYKYIYGAAIGAIVGLIFVAAAFNPTVLALAAGAAAGAFGMFAIQKMALDPPGQVHKDEDTKES